jgi:squalene-hopene/tetraprenyl-beta-curcumene cyclase
MDPLTCRDARRHADAGPLAAAIRAALGWLEDRQAPEGFWAGILESNCCIEAEWLLAFHVLGYAHPQADRIVQGILQRQRPDGAWEVYFEAPTGDINATVECYAALRSCGLPPDTAALRRAREWILAHGGLGETRVFTRYWLALIGEWPWARTPNVPPEIIHLPRWFPLNIYNFASWARATLVPLSILSAHRLVVPLPAERRLDELFPGGRDVFDYRLPGPAGSDSWSVFFRVVDRLLHGIQRLGLTPGRPYAERRCIEWVLRHQDADGAWGGIQPPWIYSVVALHAAGYPLDHPALAAGLAALDTHWSYERDGSLRIQASESPVWDTALALLAMLDAGVDPRGSPSMQAGMDWLLAQEVHSPGDWSVTVSGIPPGGAWAFERANRHYPDVDDTAMVLLLLGRWQRQWADYPGVGAAIARARRWLLAMQCRNGGWAAFDRDNDLELLTRVPFCDFGETLDPPSVDVTAHVVEALAAAGADRCSPPIRRALAFIRREQEPEGSWFGRWGVNHIYGTAAALLALRAIGEDMRSDYVRRAGDWLAARQAPEGGWGESCASYMDRAWIGRGPLTASQTAWALQGLLAAGPRDHHSAIAAGIDYLLRTQADGSWVESHYTGTGFPGYGIGGRADVDDLSVQQRLMQGAELQRGFMLNYNLYRHYFPLSALGRALREGF